MPSLPSASHLLEIDARQDDVLKRLDELERRIERVLSEYSPGEKTGLAIFRPSEDAQPEGPASDDLNREIAGQE
jgi:hypothetical protein